MLFLILRWLIALRNEVRLYCGNNLCDNQMVLGALRKLMEPSAINSSSFVLASDFCSQGEPSLVSGSPFLFLRGIMVTVFVVPKKWWGEIKLLSTTKIWGRAGSQKKSVRRPRFSGFAVENTLKTYGQWQWLIHGWIRHNRAIPTLSNIWIVGGTWLAP